MEVRLLSSALMYLTNKAYFEKMVGGEKHCGRDILSALTEIETAADMCSFFNGYVDWYAVGRNDRERATKMAKANIGHYVDRLPFLKQLKWWWCCGVTYSNVSYH